jgi:hypothetical protein
MKALRMKVTYSKGVMQELGPKFLYYSFESLGALLFDEAVRIIP